MHTRGADNSGDSLIDGDIANSFIDVLIVKFQIDVFLSSIQVLFNEKRIRIFDEINSVRLEMFIISVRHSYGNKN